jgi:hypothetical protein
LVSAVVGDQRVRVIADEAVAGGEGAEAADVAWRSARPLVAGDDGIEERSAVGGEDAAGALFIA